MSNPSDFKPPVVHPVPIDPALEDERKPKFYDRLRPYVDPFVQAAWLNLRVWVPFLANPDFRENRVTYAARESREGLNWEIILPQRCWECGATDRLLKREYDRELRSFESPVAILSSAVAVAFFFLLLGGWLGGMAYWLFLLALVAGAAMLFVKSWNERARVAISTCPEHADGLKAPGLVVYDNELSVILPTSQLAKAARDEMLAKRREKSRYSEAPPPSDIDKPRPTPATEPQAKEARYAQKDYKRDGLPPIKLDE